VGEPIAFAGYSVGELASYGCAGALDAGELASLAIARAAAMDAASVRPGGLIALRGLPRAEVAALCADRAAWIAIVNGEGAFVIGGDAAGLDAIADRAIEQGAQATRIDVRVAAHTPLLVAAIEPFRSALEHSSLRAPEVPVVAGVNGAMVTTRGRAIAALAAQLATTIEWSRCLDTLYERGCRVLLELGPGNALARIAREFLPDDVDARSVSEFRSLDGVMSWLRRH
jgi:[acyl-carrier-protein] S-malonyltransferase